LRKEKRKSVKVKREKVQKPGNGGGQLRDPISTLYDSTSIM
jgi:hypothetical protein